MRVPHRMGGPLVIDSSLVQLLAQCNSVIAMAEFYRLMSEYNANAGLIILVVIFLFYPSAIRRSKWILEL